MITNIDKPSKKKKKIRGTINRVFFASPQFSAGKIRQKADGKTGALISFAGNIYAQEDQQVVLHGTWADDPKFGLQFRVSSMEHDLDMDRDGLIRYLANSPDAKGIGPAKAEVIVKKYGDSFEKTLIEHPERMAHTAKVNISVIEQLRGAWRKNSSINAVMAYLSSFELTYYQATTLVEKLGHNCIDILKKNPYMLTEHVRGFGFKRVDKIARQMGMPKDHPGRVKAALKFLVQEAINDGHCWIEYEQLLFDANELLVMDTVGRAPIIEETLTGLIRDDKLICEGTSGGAMVALPRIYDMERSLAQTFRGQKDKANPHFQPDEIDELVRKAAPTLNDDQHLAAVTALGHSISLISGGAGSGKSYTLSAIAKIYKDRKLTVSLCAPTGKAAQRMEELSGQPASTIHRLLRFTGGVFPEDVEIDADVLIVDEVSMMDVPLAWHLLKAVNISRTAVILVGDHNQLPPVGPGNILRDLIQTQMLPMVILDKIVRQAGPLKENSAAILQGEVRPTSPRDWYMVDRFTQAQDARDALLQLFQSRLQQMGFDLIKDVQVLTPQHRGELGTQILNTALQRLLQRQLFGVKDVEAKIKTQKIPFLKHDKVIQTKNNYELNVMNGTIGYVTDVSHDGTLLIDFEGRYVELKKGAPEIRHIKLAYALTIHKAQGSEFPCTIVVVQKAHTFMHHRNLFYTGVTRARKTAIVIGDRWGVRNCAKRRYVDKRRTFLRLL